MRHLAVQSDAMYLSYIAVVWEKHTNPLHHPDFCPVMVATASQHLPKRVCVVVATHFCEVIVEQ